jgi:hypothetical protein
LKITDFDTDLLLNLIVLGGASTTDLAKLLFNPSGEYELRKHDNIIRYRLERMRKKSLLCKNGVKYSVNEERVFLTEAAMHLFDVDVDVPMGQMLVAYPKGDKILMRTIAVERTVKNSE